MNANTLYVYARTTDLTLRELDNATFAQASAAIDAYEWEIIAGAKADELIPVQTYSDLPAPTKDEVGTLYFVEADDTLYAVIPLTRYGTAATGTFGDPGNRSDFHILGDLPIPPTGYADEWAFSRNRGHFFRANASETVWNPSTAQAALDDSRSVNTYAVHFIGQLATDAEALALTPTISPETDYFFVRTSDNTLRRLTLNTFTSASNPTTFYQWRYATSKVIANPHGVTAGEALAYLQIGSQNYSIGDLSGITTSYRDRFDINEEGGTASATSGARADRQHHSGWSGGRAVGPFGDVRRAVRQRRPGLRPFPITYSRRHWLAAGTIWGAPSTVRRAVSGSRYRTA